jgi:NADPH:quinone reductase
MASTILTKAIRIAQAGGPEVMEYVDIELGLPGPGQVQIEHAAIGLNFIDVYFRMGKYPQEFPAGAGTEGAGIVRAVGAGVTHVKVGDRVAYAGGPQGSYALIRNMPAAVLIKIPKSIDFETAAGMMLKGMTTEYLFHRTYKIQKGQTILFHAAAGGVGLIAMQWARALGVTVIGTVGSEEKAKLAKKNGCKHIIYYNTENVAERVKEITKGAMVPVVYDSVGKTTWQGSLDSLQNFGLMVSFGNASGSVSPFELAPALRGSLYVTRPSLMPHIASRSNLEEMSAHLIKMVSSGKVKIKIDQRYKLSEAVQAHRDLEARKTTGSTLLLP